MYFIFSAWILFVAMEASCSDVPSKLRCWVPSATHHNAKDYMERIRKPNISSSFTLVQTRWCSEGAWVAKRHLMINRSEIKAVKLKNHLYIVWCNSQFHVVHRIIWCVAVYGLVNNWQTWTRNICLISDIYEHWSRKKKKHICVWSRDLLFSITEASFSLTAPLPYINLPSIGEHLRLFHETRLLETKIWVINTGYTPKWHTCNLTETWK